MSTIGQFDLKDFIVITLVITLFTMICISGKTESENKSLDGPIPWSLDKWINTSRDQDPWAPMWSRGPLGPSNCQPHMFFGNWKFGTPSTCGAEIMSPNK